MSTQTAVVVVAAVGSYKVRLVIRKERLACGVSGCHHMDGRSPLCVGPRGKDTPAGVETGKSMQPVSEGQLTLMHACAGNQYSGGLLTIIICMLRR